VSYHSDRMYRWQWLHPATRRRLRKVSVKRRKRQAVEARQVARAERGIEWAPPLLRNGKAAR
jgi:hypothetical protein